MAVPMSECAYCDKRATTMDALGLPACSLHVNEADEYVGERRSLRLQRVIDHLQADLNISDDFAKASDHPYSCRCAKCKDWWEQMGPDDDGLYGPFSKEEIEND